MSQKASINSPLGRLERFKAQQRVLTVDDPTATEFESTASEEAPIQYVKRAPADPKMLQELEDARKLKKEARNRAPEGAKTRLEILTGIARLSEDVEVDDVVFSIRSLKAKENREVIQAAIEITNAALQAFEIRAQTMSRSIYAINGQDIDVVIGANSFEDVLNFVQDMDESLLSHLYNRYTALIAENNKKFADLGKTEQEVIDNVKKS